MSEFNINYDLPTAKAWIWRGETISYLHEPSSCTEHNGAVVLIHGFGARKEHWRHTIKPLSKFYEVYAIDLLGFGNSSKPDSKLDGETEKAGAFRYGIELWANQVVDFIDQVVHSRVQLVGNSIGGVVALRTACLLENKQESAEQVVLIDCAQRSLDDKRLEEQPWLRRIGRPLLKKIVRTRWLTKSLFQTLSRPGVIRKVLNQAYPSGKNIDDELITMLYQPTTEPGAAESFRGFINLFNDYLAPDLLRTLQTPVRLLWGELDPWEPVAEARNWLRFAAVKELTVFPGLGHCPHDESPEQVVPSLLTNLNRARKNE